MNPPSRVQPSRRQFLQHCGVGLATCAAAGFLPRLAGARDPLLSARTTAPRALILIQLSGGFDGLGTFVAREDDSLRRLRPTLGLGPHDIVPLNDTIAVDRSGAPLERLFKSGRLTILPRVLGPDPQLGHYRATHNWHTGSESERPTYSGWLGRCLDVFDQQARPVSAHYGGRFLPRVLARDLDQLAPRVPTELDPRRPLQTATADPFTQLAEIADRAAQSDAEELYFVTLPGFDTHYAQALRHAAALSKAATALHHLQERLEQRGVGERVLTVVFSEFGRSAGENAQGGTDHGECGPMLLFGPAVRGGWQTPLIPVAYRQVLANLAADWLRVPARRLFDDAYPSLDLFS